MSVRVFGCVVGIATFAAAVLADETLYRFDADVTPCDSSAGWICGNPCDPPCSDSVEDGHYVLRFASGGDQANYDLTITSTGEPQPPTLWVEWRFSSNHPLGPNFASCDGHFVIRYQTFSDLLNMYGDAALFGNGIGIGGLALGELHTYRFESLDGVHYRASVDGLVFDEGVNVHAISNSYLQLGGRGGCDGFQNTVNRWDFVRYGTIAYGEQIIATDPPAGDLDYAQYGDLDRFTVTFDAANYVYIDDITVEVIGGIAPSVIQTRRLDNSEPEIVEVVLDHPFPLNKTIRFTFDDGTVQNVVEYTLVRPVPTVSAIGLVVLVGGLLTAGGCILRRGRRAHIGSIPSCAVGIALVACLCGIATAQRPDPVVRDYFTGEANDAADVDLVLQTSKDIPTIYSHQSHQTGRVAEFMNSGDQNGTEAYVYLGMDVEPFNYGVSLNFSASMGTLFPGTMIADDVGLGNGFVGGGQISSYELTVWRSASDPQPGPADFHVALWDGDPFCWLDTPGDGFSCAQIPGSGADFVDIPANRLVTARAILPKGVIAPNERVWMVLSGSQTANPSPCRLSWQFKSRGPRVGISPISPFLVQADKTGEGSCCGDGSACDVAQRITCAADDLGDRGFCSDGDAESPQIGWSSTFNCWLYPSACGLAAAVKAPAFATFSLVPVGANVAHTISGGEITIAASPAQVELEIRISNWDPRGEGTLLKGWEADIDSAGYRSGLQGFLTPTLVPCTSDEECRMAFGGVCTITGNACTLDSDCPYSPWNVEQCVGSRCAFPGASGGFCEPGFFFSGRSDYVFFPADDELSAVDLSDLDYRYAGAISRGDGISPPDRFPADGLYAGSLRLDVSSDSLGSFEIGFFPSNSFPRPSSVMVDQYNAFIPRLGLIPARITIPVGRCCFDLADVGDCWEDVPQPVCAAAPGPSFWDPTLDATCTEPCVQCLDDSMCQDSLWCNGTEVCDALNLCQPAIPPCGSAYCDEELDLCHSQSIPTVSVWGLMGLTLLLLTAAKICFARRETVCS